MKKQSYILMLIAFLEGFTTLAFQMVALRKAVPFVGSSVVLTSVVIGIILLALSAGYYFGGKLTTRLSEGQLMRRLFMYLCISGLYYLLIVYPSFEVTLQWLLQNTGYLPTLFLFAILFFALPTFLASHTMPIITHISSGTKGYAAGKILFVSTIGSFLGSTVTTLILFPHLGVYRTGILSSIILFVCAGLLQGGLKKKRHLIGLVFFVFLISNVLQIGVSGYKEETPYQTIHIVEGRFQGRPVRVMQLNGGWASSIDIETGKSFFPYIRTMYDIILDKKPQRIAVIGAAGCTLPQEIATLDFIEQIDVIDIDDRVFPVTENYFLQQPLHHKIQPIAKSARGWVYEKIKQGHTYDMIIVDAYNGTSLPDELVTKEFFAGLHTLTSAVLINMIADKTRTSQFSKRFVATLGSVFDTIYRKDTSSTSPDYPLGNMVYATLPFEGAEKVHTTQSQIIYTDDQNNVDRDRVVLMYQKTK